MKKIFKIFSVAALIVAAATSTLSAQVYYGVKAGANVSTVSAIEGLGDSKSDYGYQFGGVLGAKVPIIGIGVEAEALWVNNKMSFTSGGDIISNSIEVPVMLSIPVLPVFPLSVKAGPSFTLYNKAKSVADDGTKSDLDPVKSGVGYTVGVGLKLLKLTFDLRYNGQFSSSSPFKSLLGDTYTSSYDLRSSNISASIGYRF